MAVSLKKIHNLCRYTLAFVFFYHGLFPKLVVLSPIEVKMITTHNIDIPTHLLSTGAGVMEILLAFIIVFYKKSTAPLYIAGIVLIALLVDISIMMPQLLIEAFNPVSTNIASLALCYIAILTQSMAYQNTNGVKF